MTNSTLSSVLQAIDAMDLPPPVRMLARERARETLSDPQIAADHAAAATVDEIAELMVEEAEFGAES